jgi:hypothetical protein
MTFIRYYTVPYFIHIWFGLPTLQKIVMRSIYSKLVENNNTMKEEQGQLDYLQRIILDRIHERKRKIHKLHSIVYNDNLWLQIQTLEWVLSEIRSAKRRKMSSSASAV